MTELVSLREAYLDRRVQTARTSPTSRLDLLRAAYAEAYDRGLIIPELAERWEDDEPRFDGLVACPNCRMKFAITGATYPMLVAFIEGIVDRGCGGQTAMWGYVKTQMAAECGLN